jgi:FkbM family methyltransferase
MLNIFQILSTVALISIILSGDLFGLDYVSQCEQDKWAIEEVFNFKRNGYFVDIGAADGVVISNTYVLEKEFQWSGVCIEASPFWFKELVKHRNCVCIQACLDYTNHEVDFRFDNGWMGGIVDFDTDNKTSHLDKNFGILKLQTQTLEQVLDQCNAPNVIDFLSIDVEGAEHRIFKGFPFNKYTFLAMVIERPNPELNRQLQENGYVFVKNGPLDSFYVHSSICNLHNIRKEPFSQIPK